MRKIQLVILSLLLVYGAYSQVTIVAPEIPGGLVTKHQLWSITLMNAGAADQKIAVGVSVYSINENQLLFASVSKPITLGRGGKAIRFSDAEPVQYQSVSPRFNLNGFLQGFLPLGSYKVCYTIFNNPGYLESYSAEECVQVTVDALTRPQLIYPADSASLVESKPLFSWIPPAPLQLFQDLNYDLVLTEVFPNQSPLEAIQNNMPVLFQRRVMQSNLQFPTTQRQLDTGKVYAWRVYAKNGLNPAMESEVWTFSLSGKDREAPIVKGITYFELKQSTEAASHFSLKSTDLSVLFYSYLKTYKGLIVVRDSKGKLMWSKEQEVFYGGNYLTAALKGKIRSGQDYTVQVLNGDEIVFKGNFNYTKK